MGEDMQQRVRLGLEYVATMLRTKASVHAGDLNPSNTFATKFSLTDLIPHRHKKRHDLQITK